MSWIGVDLDGTLAEYDEWCGHAHIGHPIALMVIRVRRWKRQGREVRIVTGRLGKPDAKWTPDVIRRRIGDWCEAHIGYRLPVTDCKDHEMVELWDDVAVQVLPNTGLRADGRED